MGLSKFFYYKIDPGLALRNGRVGYTVLEPRKNRDKDPSRQGGDDKPINLEIDYEQHFAVNADKKNGG